MKPLMPSTMRFRAFNHPDKTAMPVTAGFRLALRTNFYLHAAERMTYLGVAVGRRDPMDWVLHRFAAFDGRLLIIPLPREARLFIWPIGRGPRPHDSVCCRRSIWGSVPQHAATLSDAEANRLFQLWLAFGAVAATPADRA